MIVARDSKITFIFLASIGGNDRRMHDQQMGDWKHLYMINPSLLALLNFMTIIQCRNGNIKAIRINFIDLAFGIDR